MGKPTQAGQGANPNGNSLQPAHRDETDSPVLPIAQLERLHAFRPDLVDWVKEQTGQEAAYRRKRQTRIDTFVLIERLAGLVAGAIISCLGLLVSAWLALDGHPDVAMLLGGGTLVGLVTVLVQGRKNAQRHAGGDD